jgi:hypothetical protein
MSPSRGKSRRRERHDRSRRDVGGPADQQPAGHKVDDRGDGRQEDADHGEEPLAAHLLAHLQAHLRRVLVGVATDLGLLPVEALRQQDARDAQRLLRDRRHVRERFLRLGGDAGAHLTDPALGDDQDGHEHERHDRELPVQQDHGHNGGDERHGVAEDR